MTCIQLALATEEGTLSCPSDINIDELPVEKMLESNHGGTTWKGFWQSSEVCIKVLKVREATQKVANCFNQECKRLRIFNSPHVLPLLASCASLPDLIIVSQYMPHGSLFGLLHEQPGLVVDFSQAINLAIHIAKGMDCLHKLEPPVMTYELNSKHVLVDEDLTARINMSDCRFSFSERDKIFDPAWMSPEG